MVTIENNIHPHAILMRSTLKVLGVSLFINLFFSSFAFAFLKVTASVDKNPAVVNESIVLTITADESLNPEALNLTPLMKDFIIGSTSVSTQTSMVNFSSTVTTKWQSSIIPKNSGQIVIPALTVDNERTQAIELTVYEKNDPRAAKEQDIFITTEVSKTDVYVQQMLTLSVKLHIATDLQRASLSDPLFAEANILQIGKDKENDKVINGKRFRVIERLYAISPQQSGDFIIESPRLSGEILMPSMRRSNFLSFAETKPVSIVGDNIKVHVRPIPTNYTGQWLPSELLTIDETWKPDNSQFTVGEPITRTITITAAGLSKEQLPTIAFEVPQGLKVYPDQAQTHTNMTTERLISQQTQSFAIVASQAGTYKLPEISISWWNTVTNAIDTAVLPAQSITVHPSTEATANPSGANTNQVSNLGLNDSDNAPASQGKTNLAIGLDAQSNTLQWLFLTLWLLTSCAWFISWRLQKAKMNPEQNSFSFFNENNTNAYLALMAACKQHDGEKALSLILPWANSIEATGGSCKTVEQALEKINNATLNQEIAQLQAYIYGKTSTEQKQNWQGNSLLATLQAINKQSKAPKVKSSLQLNP